MFVLSIDLFYFVFATRSINLSTAQVHLWLFIQPTTIPLKLLRLYKISEIFKSWKTTGHLTPKISGYWIFILWKYAPSFSMTRSCINPAKLTICDCSPKPLSLPRFNWWHDFQRSRCFGNYFAEGFQGYWKSWDFQDIKMKTPNEIDEIFYSCYKSSGPICKDWSISDRYLGIVAIWTFYYMGKFIHVFNSLHNWCRQFYFPQ